MKFYRLLLTAGCLFAFSSCNSYLSIEKRKYRDGFYVEQNIFHSKKNQEKEKNLADEKNSQTVLLSNSNAIVQVKNENSALEIIPPKNIFVSSRHYRQKANYFLKDTLHQKGTISTQKHPIAKAICVSLGIIIGFAPSEIGLFLLLDYLSDYIEAVAVWYLLLTSLLILSILLLIKTGKYYRNHKDQFKVFKSFLFGIILGALIGIGIFSLIDLVLLILLSV